jgi:hypothetical protein
MRVLPNEDPDARRRTLYVATALFLLTASFILVKTGRDALYIQDRGIFDLPAAYIGIAFLSLPFAATTLALMKFLGPRKARLVAPLAIALLLVPSSAFVSSGGGVINTAFFMFVPLAWGVTFSLSWLLAADLLEGAAPDTLARSYSSIGGASILGGLIGAIAANRLARVLDAQDFFLVGAAALILATCVMGLAQTRFRTPIASRAPTNEADEDPHGLRGVIAVLGQRYVGLLLGLSALTALMGVLIEFQFYLAVATSGRDPVENTRFFANLYLLLSGGALLIQILVVPRLQSKIGLHNNLMILPVALLGGAAALVVGGSSMLIRTGLRVTEGGLKASVHRSSWEQTYLPIKRLHRSVAKIIVDGVGPHLGEAAAAAMLWIWLHSVVGDHDIVGRNVSWIAYALMLTTTVAILATRQVRGRLIPTGLTEQPAAEIPVPDS